MFPKTLSHWLGWSGVSVRPRWVIRFALGAAAPITPNVCIRRLCEKISTTRTGDLLRALLPRFPTPHSDLRTG